MKKCLSLFVVLTMLVSLCSFPVSAEEVADVEVINVFNTETFDGYTKDVNWLTSLDTTNKYIKATDKIEVAEGAWTYAGTTDGAEIMVVSDPVENGTHGNVLKITGAKNSDIIIRRNTKDAGLKYLKIGDGYKFVYEGEIFIPATYAGGEERVIFGYGNTSVPSNKSGGVFSRLSSSAGYVGRSSGAHMKQYWARVTTNSSTMKDKWVKIKFVVSTEKANSATHSQTSRLYLNDQLITGTYGAKYEAEGVTYSETYPFVEGMIVADWIQGDGYPTLTTGAGGGNLYGITFASGGKSGTNANAPTYYIDNLKAYKVTPFEKTGVVNNTNYSAGTVDITFNSEINDALAISHDNAAAVTYRAADLVTLEDAEGNLVEDGIDSVVVDGKTLKVALKNFESRTNYKIVLDARFSDVTGQGLTNNNLPTYIDVHTADILKVTEVPESISGLIPNDPRIVTIKTSADIATATAAYAGGNVATSIIGGKIIEISFDDVDAPVTGDLVVNLATKDGQTEKLTIPVTAVTNEIDYTYNDNLEGLATGSLISADTKGTSLQNGNFVFSTTAESLGKAGTAEIVKDDAQGNVLKMSTLAAGPFRVLYDSGETHNTSRTVAEGDSGKVLVIQTKYWIPKTVSAKQAVSASAINNYASSTPGTRELWLKYTGSAYIGEGTYAGASSPDGKTPLNNTEGSVSLPKEKWITLTTVVDQSSVATGQNPDTFRFYVDGVIHKRQVDNWNLVYPDTTAPYVYDWKPQNYRGMWDMSDIAPYYKASSATNWGVVTKGDFRGTFIELGSNSGQDAHKSDIYMDEFKAWFADKFVVTSVSDNASAFVPTRHTLKVVFNSTIAENQLANIKLIDSTGAETEGMKAKIANGGYAIDFTLPVDNVKIGETYKIAFSPEFHDAVSYQGLTKNNHDYEIPVTIAEFVAFTASADITSITSFVQGRSVKAVVTLSAPADLTDATAKNAFSVVNDEGVSVTEGWTTSVSEDRKTITIDFSGLETDNYTVTSTNKLVNDDGDQLDSDPIEIIITAKSGPVMLFEEDFEGKDYTKDVNWLETAPTNDKWALNVPAAATAAKNFVGVVDAPANTKLKGKALKIYNDKSEAQRTAVKALLEESINIDQQYPGKVIIYEGDMYAVSTADGSNMFVPSYVAGKTTTQPITMKFSSKSAFKVEGAYFSPAEATNYATAEKAHFGASNDKDASNSHVKFVVDQNNDLSTIRYYVDDVVAGQKEYTYLTDHALYGQMRYDYKMGDNLRNTTASDNGTFYGVLFYPKPSSKANAEFYIDNLKVYLVDAFEITSVEGASNAFNVAKETIKLNFNAPVLSAENAAANIKLLDSAGLEVTDGLSISLAESGYQVVIRVNGKIIDGGAAYKIVVSPDLRSEDNVGLAVKYEYYEYKSTGGSGMAYNKAGTEMLYPYEWTADGKGNVTAFNPYNETYPGNNFNANGYVRDRVAMKLDTAFKTTKSTSLYAEATEAVVSGTNVSTTLTFTNPEDEALNVWYIVAAYGEFNEMLGYSEADLLVEAGSTDPIDVSFTVKDKNVKSVMVHIWDSTETMVPYHKAEELLK